MQNRDWYPGRPADMRQASELHFLTANGWLVPSRIAASVFVGKPSMHGTYEIVIVKTVIVADIY